MKMGITCIDSTVISKASFFPYLKKESRLERHNFFNRYFNVILIKMYYLFKIFHQEVEQCILYYVNKICIQNNTVVSSMKM